MSIRAWVRLVEKAETATMYHGTLLMDVPSILEKGLLPSKPEREIMTRWSTLGGVYLTNDFNTATKAAYENAKLWGNKTPIAVVVVRVNIQQATADEDVVEKALIKAFTSSLDQWGIDDAYEADLEVYVRAEEERPLERGEKPFDSERFYREFEQTLMQNMTRIAGAPRHRDPELLHAAIEMALHLADGGDIYLKQWQDLKAVW